jgi:hypothetical protein
LHSGHPRVQHREVGVIGISQTIGEVCTVYEVVEEVNVVARHGSAKEFDDAVVVAAVCNRKKALFELPHPHFAAELALENDGVFALESAAPEASGGGGMRGSCNKSFIGF